ncbi:carbohydrate deacetylase [Vibrio lamellibrachiae]|uniref:carbohydrate deacetylase n=1 Tax=Vibrio lamellibrachiae TaxID=2910253 RepID=UPI003D0FD378
MKLIMNADDFGLSESVNNGIVECIKAGVVKSTTVMMNQKAVDHAASLYKEGLIPEVGLHFTVTSGKPLSAPSEVPSLVDEHGYFIDKAELISKADVCEKEVYKELHAQYCAAIDVGFEINHIDSHHFAGVFPPLKNAFVKFVNDINLPVRRIDNIVSGQSMLRVKTPDVFDMGFFDTGATIENLKQIISNYKEKHPEGLIELMCHPSTQEFDDLTGLTGYRSIRANETEILTSPELIDWLQAQEIECVGFDVFSRAV